MAGLARSRVRDRVRRRLDDRCGHLCDLLTGEVLASAGEMNPQIRFGEDLMSRVSYVMLHPGSEKELTKVIRGCLAKLTAELATAGHRPRRTSSR